MVTLKLRNFYNANLSLPIEKHILGLSEALSSAVQFPQGQEGELDAY